MKTRSKFLITLAVAILVAAVLTCLGAGLQATPKGKFGNITVLNANTSTGTATPASFVDIHFDDARASYVAITVSGTWTCSGGLIPRGSSDDGLTWTQLGYAPFVNSTTGQLSATIASGSDGTWIVPVSGLSNFRIDAEGTVTGTASVGLNASVSAVALTNVSASANQSTVAAATGTAIKASGGQLVKVIVVTSGSAATLIYDNASALSGVVIGAIPASPAIGTVYTFNASAVNGIYAGTTNTSSFTAFYNGQDWPWVLVIGCALLGKLRRRPAARNNFAHSV